MEDETGREIREEKVHTEKNNSKLLNLVKSSLPLQSQADTSDYKKLEHRWKKAKTYVKTQTEKYAR